MPRHHGHQQRRINSAGQKRADRHIADHLALYGALEKMFQLVFIRNGLIRRREVDSSNARFSVDFHLNTIRTGCRARASIRPCIWSAEQGYSRRSSDREPHSDRILRRSHAALKGSRVEETIKEPALHSPAKRFDPQTIASRERAASQPIPDDKRKHAVKTLNDIRTPSTISFENHFGIRLGSEKQAHQRLSILPQLEEIVDLTVENNDDSDHLRFASAGHRWQGR